MNKVIIPFLQLSLGTICLTDTVATEAVLVERSPGTPQRQLNQNIENDSPKTPDSKSILRAQRLEAKEMFRKLTTLPLDLTKDLGQTEELIAYWANRLKEANVASEPLTPATPPTPPMIKEEDIRLAAQLGKGIKSVSNDGLPAQEVLTMRIIAAQRASPQLPRGNSTGDLSTSPKGKLERSNSSRGGQARKLASAICNLDDPNADPLDPHKSSE